MQQVGFLFSALLCFVSVKKAKAMNSPTSDENSLTANLRGLPRSAWILLFGTFLNKFGTFVVPFLAVYLTRLGYTQRQAGLAISVYGLGMLFAAVIGGHLADRIGRRETIVCSMFGAAASLVALGLARDYWVILALAGLAGLTAELYRPAGTALLTDLVPTKQRLVAFAAYRLAFNAGWAFGPTIGGLMAGHSFLWLFIGNAAFSSLYGILAWWALPSSTASAEARESLLEAWNVLRRDRRLAQLLAAIFVAGLIFMQICSTLSLAIKDSGFSEATYGVIISLNGVLVVLFELPLTKFTRRHRPQGMMALGFALLGVGFAINLVAHTLVSYLLVMTVFSLGEMVSMPLALAGTAELAPPHLRGRYLGLYGLTWALALVCGPSLGMWAYTWHPNLLWLMCLALGLLAAGIISVRRGECSRGREPEPAIPAVIERIGERG